MPQFVTHIVLSRRAPRLPRVRGASVDDAACDTHAYRRRLASLRTPAPDTLRARVRRELRAAAAATTVRTE
jgi:hypothetical protein